MNATAAAERHKFLFKANDDVLSFCRCEEATAMSTGQLDCPWCGCGWLISCLHCGKAFTFAVVKETGKSIIEFARQEAAARGLQDISEEEVADWADAMAEALSDFSVGDIVVYLDGSYWKLDSTDVEFEGYFAAHKFEHLPHAEALQDPKRLTRVLGDPSYWFDRESPDRE